MEQVNHYTIKQQGKVILNSNIYAVREKIEDMVCDKLDFFVMLQENDEDGDFEVYLHTDNYEDLTEKELDIINNLGFTESGEDTKVILDYLGITVSPSIKKSIPVTTN